MKARKPLHYIQYAARMEELLDLVLSSTGPIDLEYDGKLVRLEVVGDTEPFRHDPEAVREALRRSAGVLKGVDTEQLKHDLREMGYQDTPNHRWP